MNSVVVKKPIDKTLIAAQDELLDRQYWLSCIKCIAIEFKELLLNRAVRKSLTGETRIPEIK